jgi:hypothetical protein
MGEGVMEAVFSMGGKELGTILLHDESRMHMSKRTAIVLCIFLDSTLI